MWECGLKLVNYNLYTIGIKSLLMWECGLKQQVRVCVQLPERHSLCGSVD